MLKKLLRWLGLGVLSASTAASAAQYAPYATDAPNMIYGLLFCDDLMLYAPKPDQSPAPWQAVLFATHPDADKIVKLAGDTNVESRVRAIAFAWLRTHGHYVSKQILLGVVVEVPLDGGLDVLAAYADGTVRYINHSGRIAVIEPGGMPDAESAVAHLMELAKPVVASIGPWNKQRLPPPVRPNLRLSFIVSDGLYFGEGPMNIMQGDAMAGPVFRQATKLMMTVTEATGPAR